MKKLIFILFLSLLLASSSQGFIVEDRENKYAYDVSTKIEFINPNMDNFHISSSSYLVMWNKTKIHTNYGDIEGKFLSVYNFGNLTVAFGDRVEIYSLEQGELKKIGEFSIKIIPVAIDCSYPYLAFSSEKTYFIDLRDNNINELNISAEKIYIHDNYFYFSSHKRFYLMNFSSVIWNMSFDENINDFAVSQDSVYVEFSHSLSVVSDGKIMKEEQTGGIKIFLIRNSIVIEKFMVDDEGKKYWLFSFYDYNFSHIITHLIYIEPDNIYCLRDKLIIFDGEYTYLLNDSLLIFRSKAMESSFFNGTIAYLLENNTIELMSLNWNIINSGRDNDGDWLMDKYDTDDDNDGIPDWWEEKYDMNPENPNDANKDYDDDGLTNYQEYLNHTNPRNWDTDGDGLSDGFEVAMGLNPLSRDSDHDGFSDSWELRHGMNPRVSDRGYIYIILVAIFIILILAGIKRIKK